MPVKSIFKYELAPWPTKTGELTLVNSSSFLMPVMEPYGLKALFLARPKEFLLAWGSVILQPVSKRLSQALLSPSSVTALAIKEQ